MRLGSFFRNLFLRRRVEEDLNEELTAYLEQLTDENLRRGMPADEARRAARLEAGGMEQIKEEVRDVRTGHFLEELFHDVRYGLRTLRKNPAFSLVAVMVLALGIGAVTAMFSVAYGILLRPLPYAGAERTAVVYMRFFPRDFAFGTMCMRDFLMWRENNRAFEQPELFRSQRMDIGGQEGPPVQVQGASVTAGFFAALGVQPILGRTFAPGDDRPAGLSLAVLSETLWRRRFGQSQSILGESILVNGAPATVVGVAPASLQFPRRDTEVWTSLPLNPPTRYGPWFYRGLARLKSGVTLEQAQAETNRIAHLMMEQNPKYQRLALPVVGLRDALLGITLKPALAVLAGAVGMVLLIALVNVANLMLVRATAREREIALRLVLGAGRRRLLRQLLTESVLLAILGGAAGLALAWGGIRFIRDTNAGNLPLIDSVKLDGGALGFMLLISTLAGVLFGLAPALTSSRADLNSTVKEGGRSGAGLAGNRIRSALVVSQIAVSLMLLIGAGLLLRSFANLQRVSGGISTPPRQLLSILISPANRRDPNIGLAYYQEVLRRVRAVPGVESASITDTLPPDRQADADTFEVEGHPLPPGQLNPIITHADVDPDYFQTLGIPLLKGRYFTGHDNQDSTPVAIVSEGFVRRFLPGEEPIGKRLRNNNSQFEIVGVVGNAKYLGLTADTDPAFYFPFTQNYVPLAFLAIRSSKDAARLAEPLRQAVQAIDPGATLAQIRTMEEQMALSISQPRFDSILLGLFAAIALLLSAVGIYGLIAYSVAHRTHEIGVRMALGAEQANVLWMVVRRSASLAAVGIAIGVAGALGLTRLLGAMLFGVGANDLPTFAAALAGMMFVVLLAALIPALRATRISPVTALRYQ